MNRLEIAAVILGQLAGADRYWDKSPQELTKLALQFADELMAQAKKNKD